jgi:hypothetical protein
VIDSADNRQPCVSWGCHWFCTINDVVALNVFTTVRHHRDINETPA